VTAHSPRETCSCLYKQLRKERQGENLPSGVESLSISGVQFFRDLVGNEVENKSLSFFRGSEKEVVVIYIVTITGFVRLSLKNPGKSAHLNFLLS